MGSKGEPAKSCHPAAAPPTPFISTKDTEHQDLGELLDAEFLGASRPGFAATARLQAASSMVRTHPAPMQLPVPPPHTPYRFLIPIQNVLFGEEPQAVHQGHFPIAFLWEEGTVRGTEYGAQRVGWGGRGRAGTPHLGDGQGEVPEGVKGCGAVATLTAGQ